MNNEITIRNALTSDQEFIFALSPRLAEVAKLPWHTDNNVQAMQDNYIDQMLTETAVPHRTLIAEQHGIPLGFIHAREYQDGISGETCGTVPLLAISPSAQGLGVGQLLMKAAEAWAKEQGYRLLHLEVFANNDKARGFYQKQGFEPETLHMIKPLTECS